MKNHLFSSLALCSGLAFADAPQVTNSIDKTAESVAPAFNNPYKDVGNIPVTFLTNPTCSTQHSWLTSN